MAPRCGSLRPMLPRGRDDEKSWGSKQACDPGFGP